MNPQQQFEKFAKDDLERREPMMRARDYEDAPDDLSAARGFLSGLAIAGAFWVIVTAFTLAWFLS